MFEKVMAFAENGNGRRLLNTLNKKNNGLTRAQLNEVLQVYGHSGLCKEVQSLKTRRGILDDARYNAMAKAVRANCCAERYEDFSDALRSLLRSGMTMNPTKMDEDQFPCTETRRSPIPGKS